ncbi:LPS biosynthesis protein [Planctomycetota bacterium]|nr:LPS biosynthesis protein [Planctomycetota bacterium]
MTKVTNPSAHPEAIATINATAKSAFFFQDYAGRQRITGVEIVELKRFNDDGGAITELGRFATGMHSQLPGFECKQVNYSEMEPNAVKAFHLHHRQTDVWYVPPCDKLLLVLHDCRHGSPSEGSTMRLVLGDGKDRLVRIPPGVAHGAGNIGQKTGRIIYMVDVQFSPNPNECDEGRLPWDFLGAEIWDVAKG